MRRKSTVSPARRLGQENRNASNSPVANAAPASALAYAANRNLITMTVGLLSSGPATPSPVAPVRSSALRECDETALTEQLCHEIEFLKHRLDRRCLKTSKVCESYVSYFEQYAEFDPFLTPCEPSNPCKTSIDRIDENSFLSLSFRVDRLDGSVGIGENRHGQRNFFSTCQTVGLFHQRIAERSDRSRLLLEVSR